jgi:hypothetical protein
VRGSGCGLSWGTVPEIFWRSWGEPCNVAARTVSVPVEIRKNHPPPPKKTRVRNFTVWFNLLDGFPRNLIVGHFYWNVSRRSRLFLKSDDSNGQFTRVSARFSREIR